MGLPHEAVCVVRSDIQGSRAYTLRLPIILEAGSSAAAAMSPEGLEPAVASPEALPSAVPSPEGLPSAVPSPRRPAARCDQKAYGPQ